MTWQPAGLADSSARVETWALEVADKDSNTSSATVGISLGLHVHVCVRVCSLNTENLKHLKLPLRSFCPLGTYAGHKVTLVSSTELFAVGEIFEKSF